ncbi:MAG TPA: 1-acyl-sn-glycerol-3-phosphate acyltransferase [Rhodospirillaceae bacterium]|nr:1-acyl-sn-glycerol-3-phosphate acyltransferase [Rhodospirillaceae bacterium]
MGWAKYPWLVGKLFALFFIFVGGGVLATIIVPVVMFTHHDRQEQTQNLVRVLFRFYLWLLQATKILSITFEGGQKLAQCKGAVVIANHPSLLDVVILMAYIPRAQCIVKHELWNHFFLGCLMRAAGYIRNDLPPEDLVASCRKNLQDGRCLIIFPEGTRTPIGTLPKLHRGFANIAFLTQAPIQTVVITCIPPTLYKGEPWWKVPLSPPVFSLVLGPYLDKGFYFQYGQRGIAVRKLVEYLDAYYRKMLSNG